MVAAPGPSPNAGTLPICFEIVSEDVVESDTALSGRIEVENFEEVVEIWGCSCATEIEDWLNDRTCLSNLLRISRVWDPNGIL